MYTIGPIQFPETEEEVRSFETTKTAGGGGLIRHSAMTPHCLAIAVMRCEGAWSCYMSDVFGTEHSKEAVTAWRRGYKTSETIARAIFPGLKAIPYAK